MAHLEDSGFRPVLSGGWKSRQKVCDNATYFCTEKGGELYWSQKESESGKLLTCPTDTLDALAVSNSCNHTNAHDWNPNSLMLENSKGQLLTLKSEFYHIGGVMCYFILKRTLTNNNNNNNKL